MGEVTEVHAVTSSGCQQDCDVYVAYISDCAVCVCVKVRVQATTVPRQQGVVPGRHAVLPRALAWTLLWIFHELRLRVLHRALREKGSVSGFFSQI